MGQIGAYSIALAPVRVQMMCTPHAIHIQYVIPYAMNVADLCETVITVLVLPT